MVTSEATLAYFEKVGKTPPVSAHTHQNSEGKDQVNKL